MLKDYIKLTYRNLKDRGIRSWLTMIGIFIGIAAVVSLVSLGQGLQDAVYDQFVSLGGNAITIQPQSSGAGPPGTLAASKLTDDDLEEIRRVNGVTSAFGRLIKPVQVEFNDEQEVIFMASLPEEQDDRDYLAEARDIIVQDGIFLDPDDGLDVMVGNNYYRNDVFGRPINAGDKVEINGTTVDVKAVLERTGSPEIDISFQINEEAMRDLLDIDDEYSAILARAESEDAVDQVANRIERTLRNARNVDEGEEDFNVQTSQELLQSFSNILDIVTAVLVGIAAISLLVGGIGIMNTMFTSVLERTREIGIMKSVGARNSDILTLFLVESGMLGMAGGGIGVILGVTLSKLVEYAVVNFGGFEILQASFPWYLIVGALAFSMIVGMLSGIIPAIRASRMDPVEALEG